jgi:hypothetical protein
LYSTSTQALIVLMLKDKTLHIVALPLLMLRSYSELGTHLHLFILWVDVVPDGVG